MNGYGRGADNKERGKGVVTRETLGMTFLIFSVILLVIATVGRFIFGEIGVSITAFLLGTFGFFLYPLLVLMLYGSVCMVAGRSLIPAKWMLKVTAVLLGAFLIAHLATSARFTGSGYGAYLSGCYTAAAENASSATAGGALYGLAVYPVQAVLSQVGAYVLFSLLEALALFVFLWSLPFKRTLLSGKTPAYPVRRRREKQKKQPPREKARPVEMPDPEPMMGYAGYDASYDASDDAYADTAYADPYAPQYGVPQDGQYYGGAQEAQSGYRNAPQGGQYYGQGSRYEPQPPQYHAPAQPQQRQYPQYDRPYGQSYPQNGQPYGQSYPQNDRPYGQSYPQNGQPYGYGQNGYIGYYGFDRPARPVQGYYAPQDRESQGYGRNGHVGYYGSERPSEPAPPRSYTGRDILFSNTPAQDYARNLIYDQDSYFNSRVRRSSVKPDDSPARKPDYTIPATYERPTERSERDRRTPGGEREIPKFTSHQDIPRSERRADAGRSGYGGGKDDGFLRPDFGRSDMEGSGSTGRSGDVPGGTPAPSSYRDAFSEQTENNARTQLPRKIVEQRPERRGGQPYTFRAEDLNYPRVPAYKAPETPPEEIGRDAYANDVDDTEFSSAPNVDDIVTEPSTPSAPSAPSAPADSGFRRAAWGPEPEPVRSDGFLAAGEGVKAGGDPFDTPEVPASSAEDDGLARGRDARRGEENASGRTSSDAGRGRGAPRAAQDDYDPEKAERGFRSLFSASRGADRVQLKDDGVDYVGDRFGSERGRRTGLGNDEPAEPERRTAFEPAPEDGLSGAARPGFGEESRAARGLRSERSSADDLFDDDLLPESDVPGLPDVPSAVRGEGFGRGRGAGAQRDEDGVREPVPVLPAPPAPKPKKHVYKRYRRPPHDLFRTYDDAVSVSPEEIKYNSSVIVETLAGFRVDAQIVKVTSGPAVTRYDIDIPRNISVRSVIRHDEEIAMRLHARDGVNMYSNSEVGAISVEVPNKHRAMVGIRSIMDSPDYRNDDPSKLMFVIGKDVEGRAVCGDIVKMTHILVAGATNSGKSVCLNSMLVSLICKYSPEDLRIILIDPKKIEFTPYDGLPHLMINEIITDTQKAIMSLNWAIKEMERRYGLFEQKTRSGTAVRNINEYNANLEPEEEKLPKIVIVVDELADLMSVAKKDIEERIQRLTQKARAAGIHLVIATQRPSVDVITGVIKGNLPTRMAFRVIQEVDSRTILDEQGAEKLLGNGDMLYKTGGMFNCLRVQGAFLSSAEVAAVVANIKENNEAYFDPQVSDYINRSSPDDGGDGDDDGGDGGTVGPEYIKALAIVVKLGSASISLIQRKCAVGYNHAGKIIEWMELMGYISPFDGKAKARTVLLTKEEFESKYGDLD